MIPLAIAIGLGNGDNEDRPDYRSVPSSDRGNASYRDQGKLGSYSTGEEPFQSPADVRFDAGFGADTDDLQRGYCEPLITENPSYQLENYKNRSSQPMESDVTPGNLEAMPDDMEFRSRNRKSRGFLTRPRLPIER